MLPLKATSGSTFYGKGIRYLPLRGGVVWLVRQDRFSLIYLGVSRC